jgi:hypothetical protein
MVDAKYVYRRVVGLIMFIPNMQFFENNNVEYGTHSNVDVNQLNSKGLNLLGFYT